MDLKQEISEKVRRNWEISLLATIFLILQLAILYNTAGRSLGWDPSVYVGMGKYLYSLGEIGYWEPLRPVLLPMLLGLFWVLGFPMLTTAPFVTIIIAVLTVLGIYSMLKDQFNKEIGLFTSGILMSSYIFFHYNTRVGTETLAVFFIFLAIYLIGNQRYFSSGIFTSLAFLTRYPSALIGPAMTIYIVLKGFKNKNYTLTFEKLVKYGLGTLTLLIPFFVINHYFYGNFLAPIISGYTTPLGNPEQHFYGIYYMVEVVTDNFFYILAPIGAALAIYNRESDYMPFLTALAFLYGFQEYYPHKEERYALIFLPLLALFAAYTLCQIQQKQQIIDKKHYRYLIVAILGLMLISVGTDSYNHNNWVDEDREEYYSQFKNFEGTVGANEPAITVYGDFKYVQFPIEQGLVQIYEQNREDLNYIGIDDCAWYDIQGIDTETVTQEFENKLKENHEIIYHQEYEDFNGNNCTRYIFEINSTS